MKGVSTKNKDGQLVDSNACIHLFSGRSVEELRWLLQRRPAGSEASYTTQLARDKITRQSPVFNFYDYSAVGMRSEDSCAMERRAGPAKRRVQLVLAEQLFAILDKADQHHNRRSREADKKHGVHDPHDQSNQTH